MVFVKTYSKKTDFARPLEYAVFQNTRKHFKVGQTDVNSSAVDFHKSKPSNSNQNEGGNGNGSVNKVCLSLPVEFCHNSTIHGLSFIGRPKAHLTERIFWAFAFILGVFGAVVLIDAVWKRYYKNPVIVSFQAQEVDTDSIPFPSVTICNMNAFPKSKVQLFERRARGSDSTAKTAKEYLKYVRSICKAQRSFAEEQKFARQRGMNGQSGWNFTISEDSQDEMMDFLLEHTTPCNNLIRLCKLGETKAECSDIFKPVITDYGKCCTFNILPLPLLMKNPLVAKQTVARKRKGNVSDPDFNPALGKKRRWSKGELERWLSWDYRAVGFSLQNKSLPQPFRQKRAGMPYGLSILVDANLHDSYCPISDSEGFRFLLHNPLEMPHIDEFASVMDLNKEILIEVHPDVTNADDDIQDIQRKDRNCYFPKEIELQFFQPYTGGNCIDECTAILFGRKCNCTHFFMPRDDNMNICNMDPISSDFECINSAKIELLETIKTECGHCYPLCEDVQYHFETTMSTLQDSSMLWLDPDIQHYEKEPEWAKNKMSIMHIFLGSDTVVPKYRKRLYGTTDLIANTGGMLGLCLGFSVLSLVEIIYFLTLRAFFVCWRRRRRANRLAAKFAERVIQLDVDRIPMFRQPTFSRLSYPNRNIDCERYVNGIRVSRFKKVTFKTKIA